MIERASTRFVTWNATENRIRAILRVIMGVRLWDGSNTSLDSSTRRITDTALRGTRTALRIAIIATKVTLKALP